jgi:uncharacterized protein
MNEIDNILNATSHRPWDLPIDPWRYYQEWNNALFLHWKVPTEELTRLIPKNISLDTFNGESWISLVAFTMERIRPRYLPSVSTISDFHEVNLRTYVTNDNKSGVYFLSIEAEKHVSCFVARLLSGLPYTKSQIRFQTNTVNRSYSSNNPSKDFHLAIDFSIGERTSENSHLHTWLTERYSLYLEQGEKVFRYETHHKPWVLHDVKISELKTRYKFGNISLLRKPDLVHFSPGVKVVAWKSRPVAG